MSEIARIEALAKKARRRPAFDEITDWSNEFREGPLSSYETAAESVSEIQEGSDLFKFLDSLDSLAEEGMISDAFAGKVRALRTAVDEVAGEENPFEQLKEQWEAFEEKLTEMERAFDSPKEYETDEKDAMWDELTTSLGDISDTLKVLVSGTEESMS
ncbi:MULTISPECIES: hypothetical protein [unclassified Streptomyces]|uniref:hypothetical protein n=1 Tax=unclassified Streptomyces TaxID=2593676 RepID=UPI00081EECC4|nr:MULTISPECIES: hypothetical protein [unclassified Streptomyces]MYR95472.1 hypothetical protein [Streptomyces sp. SID4937]SCD90985.1 hypothetical protein GA0115243_104757 [Streptomyces sp. ScaeMP-e83]